MRASSGDEPLTVRFPLVGFSKEAIALKKVVFPHPDGPINETNSPSSIFKETSFKATTSSSAVSKIKFNFSAEIMAFFIKI